MKDDEASPARAQCRGELDHAVADELDAPVGGIGKPVEDLAIEDERAVHRARRGECRVKRRVVEVAKVAPEPDRAPGSTINGFGARETKVIRTNFVPPERIAIAVVRLERNAAIVAGAADANQPELAPAVQRARNDVRVFPLGGVGPGDRLRCER